MKLQTVDLEHDLNASGDMYKLKARLCSSFPPFQAHAAWTLEKGAFYFIKKGR